MQELTQIIGKADSKTDIFIKTENCIYCITDYSRHCANISSKLHVLVAEYVMMQKSAKIQINITSQRLITKIVHKVKRTV